MNRRSYSFLLLFAVCAGVAGCSESDACGPGFKSSAGTCVADDSAAGSAGSTAGAASLGGSGGTSAAGGVAGTSGGSASDAGASSDGFGDVCSVNEDCSGATNYCAKSPLDPVPYCTATGCDQDATICPANWTCFNVGLFSPGAPYMCAKPAN